MAASDTMPGLNGGDRNGTNRVTWDWRVGPQTVISGLNLLVLLGGIVWVVAGIEVDVKVARDQVNELKRAVDAIAIAETQQAVDSASVKAKVDIILPIVQKLQDQQTIQLQRTK